MDVENMPAEKEMRFKEKIVASRLERHLAKWKLILGRIFGFIFDKLRMVFRWANGKLREEKKKYTVAKEPEEVLPEDKEAVIGSLFMENESFDDDDFDKKEANLIKIIGLDSGNIKAFQLLGELYFLNRKNEEAKQTWAHALKLLDDGDTEKQAEIYNSLAVLYKESEDLSSALETAKMASKLAPNSPRYLDSLAEISIMNKDKTSAEEAVARLAEVNPENGKLADFNREIEMLE